MKRSYTLPTLRSLFPNSTIWHEKLHPIKTQKKILQLHTREYNDNLLHNISRYKLTKDEQNILSRGLNFAPKLTEFTLTDQPTSILNTLKKAINTSIYIDGKQQSQGQNTGHPFRNTKDWLAPTPTNYEYNQFFDEVSESLLAEPHNHHKTTYKGNKHNYTLAAINKLQCNKDIIIKKCDKGSGICIMDKEDYINKIFNEHLNNKSTYRELNYDPTPHIKYDTNTLIDYLPRETFL